MPVLPCRTEKALSFSLWFFPQWLLTIFDQIDVSSFARIFTFVLQFKTLKTPLACTLLIHPTVSLPDYFPTQLWTSRMLFGRGGRDRAKQFLLPRSILTGKLFHSSDVRRHFNHRSSDPDASSGNSAQFLLREAHKAAIVTNSASNG